MSEYKRLVLPLPKTQVRVEFKLEDMWVGVFWKAGRPMGFWQRFDVWVCLLPTLPLHVTWYKRVSQERNP